MLISYFTQYNDDVLVKQQTCISPKKFKRTIFTCVFTLDDETQQYQEEGALPGSYNLQQHFNCVNLTNVILMCVYL